MHQPTPAYLESLEAWKEYFSKLDYLPLPLDRNRPFVRDGMGDIISVLPKLKSNVAFREFCKLCSCSAFDVFAGLAHVFFHKISGNKGIDNFHCISFIYI